MCIDELLKCYRPYCRHDPAPIILYLFFRLFSPIYFHRFVASLLGNVKVTFPT